MPRVLREPPFDGLKVVREIEPQDLEGNRGAKTQRVPSSQKLKYMSLLAWLSPRLIRPLADFGGVLAP